jgi:dihydroorotate dehydrogenase (fumarate)
MVDISTTYLGLHLQNPLVASSSPLTERFETSQKLEAAGVGGLVMYSLFEEQIIQESLRLNRDLERGSYSTFEALSFLPEMGRYTLGADVYVERLQQIKKAVNIPVIGSLNGFSTGGWIDYAQKIEQAGADALELNLYYLATDQTGMRQRSRMSRCNW